MHTDLNSLLPAGDSNLPDQGHERGREPETEAPLSERAEVRAPIHSLSPQRCALGNHAPFSKAQRLTCHLWSTGLLNWVGYLLGWEGAMKYRVNMEKYQNEIPSF